ncbi:MAG: FKBP-type peptidyl-prolyl cis-trans isomerase [Halobacteriovoraceae bacterium]|jgi:FKBP-type peptidyl-prolyl cis-trans isomerase FklB|nr:FKBP-type peptidyl-prolyl cis-trans isomerase [Halobacteriovoraceae bacterium]
MESDQQKVSYIIGRQIGGDFKKQSIEICFDEFFQGVRSSFLEEPSEVNDEEVTRVMDAFQEKMKAAHEELSSEAGKMNRTLGEAFLAENKKVEGVTVTASGLQYRVLESGTGATPALTSTVETHYEGSLINGSVFDSSYQRGETISFPVNGVIPGWTEALQLMKEGDIWELAIPSDLAYGAQGAGGAIEPDSTLKFKIELIKVK